MSFSPLRIDSLGGGPMDRVPGEVPVQLPETNHHGNSTTGSSITRLRDKRWRTIELPRAYKDPHVTYKTACNLPSLRLPKGPVTMAWLPDLAKEETDT